MTASSQEYRTAGLHRILGYKAVFDPLAQQDNASITKFINLFCEYQLADNNYSNIHFEASANKDNESWFNRLSLDQVLQFITYIIWTDKFNPGYMISKISDRTMHRLLSRAEAINDGSILPSTGE